MPIRRALVATAGLATLAALAAPAPAQEAPPHDLVNLPAVAPGQPGIPGDTGPIDWPDEVPEGSPFPESELFSHLSFPGQYVNRETLIDTIYPSWGADDKLYSPFMDGNCGAVGAYGGVPNPVSVMGTLVATGSTPHDLTHTCGSMVADYGFDENGHWEREFGTYDGRYASANLHHDGVWYIGSYLLDDQPHPGADACGLNYCSLGPFVGFEVSRDNGLTWERSPHTPEAPLFGEKLGGDYRVKLGALHTVDYGKNNEHAPGGFMYLVGHGGGGPTSEANWVTGDDIYLVRVQPSPETVNDPSAYEFYAGKDAEGQDVWSKDLADLQPLVSWPGHLGNATVTYDAELDRYLMWISRPHDGKTTTAQFDTMLLEAPSLTGPWSMVHYLPRFGAQAYFMNTPSKFIADGGERMWLSYSANFSNYDSIGAGPDGVRRGDPEGSLYNWVLREMVLHRK